MNVLETRRCKWKQQRSGREKNAEYQKSL